MKIGFACDHSGLKANIHGFIVRDEIIKYLKDNDYDVVDMGPKKLIPTDDYPDYMIRLGEAIRDKKIDYGIIMCGTGIGASIACNKVKGVRCAKVNTMHEAKMTRLDNDANVLSVGMNISLEKLHKIIDTFLTTPSSDHERHRRRIEKITNYER